MTFGEFTAFISSEMNKGSTYDAFIPARIRMAGIRLEQNYTFKYMENIKDLTLEVDSDTILIPVRTKALEWLRRTTTDSQFVYLAQVDAQQFLNLQTDFPSGFWVNGVTDFRFDCRPVATAVELEGLFNLYSDWANAVDSSTFWLLDNAASLMTAMTMMYLAPVAREPTWIKLYEQMQTEGEKVLELADQALRRASRDEVMLYANRGSSG